MPQMASSKAQLDGSDVGPEEDALLKLSFLLEGNREGRVEGDDVGPGLGAAETLGGVEGELEGAELEPWPGYFWELGKLGQMEGI